eukprot:6167053-Amphidinium_carterae.1
MRGAFDAESTWSTVQGPSLARVNSIASERNNSLLKTSPDIYATGPGHCSFSHFQEHIVGRVHKGMRAFVLSSFAEA